jgi:hypothetical protein
VGRTALHGRAAEHGLCITKPWGEMSHYDFAIEYQGCFVRVQVKSTKFLRRGSYACCVFTRSGPYGPNQIDFVAAYIIPLDIWYIIPAHVFEGQYHIHLSPHRKNRNSRPTAKPGISYVANHQSPAPPKPAANFCHTLCTRSKIVVRAGPRFHPAKSRCPVLLAFFARGRGS